MFLVRNHIYEMVLDTFYTDEIDQQKDRTEKCDHRQKKKNQTLASVRAGHFVIQKAQTTNAVYLIFVAGFLLHLPNNFLFACIMFEVEQNCFASF